MILSAPLRIKVIHEHDSLSIEAHKCELIGAIMCVDKAAMIKRDKPALEYNFDVRA